METGKTSMSKQEVVANLVEMGSETQGHRVSGENKAQIKKIFASQRAASKTIQAVQVKRFKDGSWTHPNLPYWDEGTTTDEITSWAVNHGLDYIKFIKFQCDAPSELTKRWCDGDADAFTEWKPKCDVEGAFLLSIYETEDGPAAMYAMPKSKPNIPSFMSTEMNVLKDGYEIKKPTFEEKIAAAIFVVGCGGYLPGIRTKAQLMWPERRFSHRDVHLEAISFLTDVLVAQLKALPPADRTQLLQGQAERLSFVL